MLGKKKFNHDRSWHCRKCLGKECVHALSFALGPDNFCSSKTARILSAVKTSCLFAGSSFQGILHGCVSEMWTISQWHCIQAARPCSAWLLDVSEPSSSEGAKPGDKQMVGSVLFSCQKVWMLKSKHFLCRRPVISLLEDEQNGGFYVRCWGFICEVAAWCCVFSPKHWVRTPMSECFYCCFLSHSLKWRSFSQLFSRVWL